ncbi:MAG: Zn-dependent alcohol dehydrogenase [Acidimicrobiaceae bacterium]|nr:Zn-dependent alcohol dehydrogenase [Acidimicrobiaceae bacterium]
MLAAVLRNTGDQDLDVTDTIEVNDPGPDDVVVKITHTGVCHSDVSAMNGTIPTECPAVLGHEGAGIIDAVGDNVTEVAVGDHVIVVWSPPCGGCRFCIDHKSPNLCITVQFGSMMIPHFTEANVPVHAMAGAGTFAEKTLLPKQAVVKIDPDIPLDIASLIGCGVMTGAGAALNTAKITPGSSVIVYGAGGVGVAAIQGARIAGAAEIVAVDLNDAKLDDARRFGATHAVKPEDVDGAKLEITGGDGFDYALECIGNPLTMRASFDAVRRGGTACIVGVGRMEEMVQFSAFELFFSEKILVGSYYGGTDVRSDFHKLLRLYKQGKLDLEGMITRRITIDEINPALEAVRNGEVIRQVIEF